MAQPDFGRYKIVEEVGRGAMGVVYRATDPAIGRTVALKVINESYLDTIGVKASEYFERFRREAETAGRLSHPNIVKIYDLGPRFIVMEFVEGESLASIIRARKRLPLSRILQFVVEAADALDYAHRQGVVHRDVKPANFMIQPSGVVKVMDFGLARIESSTLTAAGEILGSAAYMAPEVIMGRTADARSDIFSLGVVTYELMTGDRPFGGGSISTIISKILRESPRRARELNVKLPPDYDEILARVLAKEPESRYPTAGEFASALVLKKWGDEETGAEAPAPSNTQTLSPVRGVTAEEGSGEEGSEDMPPTVDMTAAEYAAMGGAQALAGVPPPTASETTLIPKVGSTVVDEPVPEVDARSVPATEAIPKPVLPSTAAETPVAEEATLVGAGPLEDLLGTGQVLPPSAVERTVLIQAADMPVEAPATAEPVLSPPPPPELLAPPELPAPPEPPAPPAPASRDVGQHTLPVVPGAGPPRKRLPWVALSLGCAVVGIVGLLAAGYAVHWAFSRPGAEAERAAAPEPTPAAPTATAAPEVEPAAPAPAPEATASEEPAAVAPTEAPRPAKVAPARLPGRLSVTSNPPGATVVVGRQPRGTTPLKLEMPAGRVSVEVRKDGFKPWSRQVALTSGAETAVEARLEPIPTAAPATPTPAPAVQRGDLVPLTPEVSPPRKLSGENPSLPRGVKPPVSVLVEYVVTEDGRVTNARVVESGGAALDRACLEAVSTWRFQPAETKGVQVKVTRTTRFTFQGR